MKSVILGSTLILSSIIMYVVLLGTTGSAFLVDRDTLGREFITMHLWDLYALEMIGAIISLVIGIALIIFGFIKGNRTDATD
ncbi:hypothetical protein [Geomicrobium sp. JCM 19055]|uniref:hypothetical protein n=1 Tax=Geomicrobium sp. JCM 19055 TaxID=1460649 RepID=UPI00045EDD8A|nr:hypothetical protein [Geomicrobium sp. JCM 19055]GAJ97879.1 hypothetical protein JCM19055_767 [Geomicrobium sp. JCM 19055]